MANIKLAYAADTQLTITLASLATSSSLLVGRESVLIDNSSNLFLDYLLSGKITVGTTPTINTQIQVCVVAPINDTPTWPDAFTGTDAAVSVTVASIKIAICRVIPILIDSTTSNRTYPFGPVSVASLFGGVCPQKFLVFVTHNTGVNLNSTGSNHEISIQGVYQTVA